MGGGDDAVTVGTFGGPAKKDNFLGRRQEHSANAVALGPVCLPMSSTTTPLRRSKDQRWVAGICGGIARRYGWNPGIVRLIWLIATVIPVLPGLPAYLILWFVLSAD